MPDRPDSAADAGRRPWLRSYPADVDWAAEIPAATLLDAFDEALSTHGKRTCIHFLGKEYTYAHLGDLVQRAAHGLQARGVRKGVKVGLLLPNTPYFVVLYYAILRAGGTVVNFNPLYAVTEVVELVRNSETKILATLDIERLWDKAIAAQQATALEHVIACRMTEILPFVKSLLFPILHYGELVMVTDAPAVVRFADLIDNVRKPSLTNGGDHEELARTARQRRSSGATVREIAASGPTSIP